HLDVARRRTGFAEGTDDGEPLRIERRRDEDPGTAGQARRHPYRVAGGTAPAVHGKTDEVEVEQLAELAAELEPRLIASVVGRGRAPHGREELVAADDLVARCRDVVLPAAGAEEADVRLTRLVASERLPQMARQVDLRFERRRQMKLAAQPVVIGDLREQLVDRRGTDRVEHLLLDLGDR